MLNIATTRSTPAQRIFALGVALVVTGAGLAAMAIARTPGPELPAFLPSLATASVLLDFITAYILFGQFVQTRYVSLVFLAAAFLYSSLIVVPYALTFPGVFSETGLWGAGPQTTAWLWVFWHAGFPVLVLLYVRAEAKGNRRVSSRALRPIVALVTVITIALVYALSVVATTYHNALPPLVVENDYWQWIKSGGGPLLLGVSLWALGTIVWVTRLATTLQLWLAVALLVWCLDVLVTLLAGSRYTIGWYVSRTYSALASMFVLFAFLFGINKLYVKLGKGNAQLERLAHVDALTQIANRLTFDERIDNEWARHARDRLPLTLIMIDIDLFKVYNDTYGHLAGDECLRKIARAIDAACHRPTDFAARYGGEEFVVILPNTPRASALHVAEAIRTGVEALKIEQQADSGPLYVTVSMGIASEVPAHGQYPQDLIAHADAALYEAKHSGRNRVRIAT